MAPTGPTAVVTALAQEIMRSGLPDRVTPLARRHFVDTLAAAARGASTPTVELLATYLEEFSAPGHIPVPGREARADLLGSVQLVGTAAALGSDRAPAASVEAINLAAASTLGFEQGSTCQQVLAAFAVGCQVTAVLAAALPSGPERAWNNTIASGVMGSCLTAGLLLGLEQQELRMGLGIAASQLVGHRETDGTSTEAYLAGKAAVNGVHSALLAYDGITASPEVLEHPRGFFAVLDRDRPSTASDAVRLLDAFRHWPPGEEAAAEGPQPSFEEAFEPQADYRSVLAATAKGVSA